MKLRASEPQALLSETIDRLLNRERVRVLDVGAGNVIGKNRRAGQYRLVEQYTRLAEQPGYIPVDIAQGEGVKLVGDAHNLPVASSSLDGVLMVSVLEHLAHPHAAVDEVLRVLKPGGLYFSYAPFYHPYHASPHDYFRFTREGYRYLLRGFAEAQIISGGNYVAALNDVLAHGLGDSRPGRLLARGLVELPLRPLFRLLDARLEPTIAVGFAALAVR